MDGVVSSKTVVGEAIHIGDTIILPLVDVSFAVGAGAFNADKKEKRCRRYRWEDDTKRGAGSFRMVTPSLWNIKNQDTITKLLDMVPDVMDRFTSRKEDNVTEEDVNKILDEAEK